MSITSFLHEAIEKHPHHNALIYEDKITTYEGLKNNISRFASAISALNTDLSKPMSILSLNSNKYIETMLTVFWLGGVINPMNIRWAIHEMVYVLNECESEILFVDKNFTDIVNDLKHSCPLLKHVIYLGDDDLPGLNIYHAMVRNHQGIVDSYTEDDRLAAVFYTSGTTGKPKGVMLTHSHIKDNAWIASTYLQNNTGIAIQVPPLFHIGGVNWLIQVLQRHMPLVILKGFDVIEVYKTIQKYQITESFFVPTMLQMLINSPESKKYNLTTLKRLIYGGSAINRKLITQASEIFPNVGFVQFYGMTEASPCVTVLDMEAHNHDHNLKPGGFPLHQCTVKIVDSEGRELQCNQVGEIIVSGSNIMLGYWKKPKETKNTLKNGWLYTGDGGYLREDGFLVLVDRIKDMIITGGENVYSTEVENVIMAIEGVGMCAVIGIPHDVWGESVHAVIIPKEGYTFSNQYLDAHCRKYLSGFKCPKSYEFTSDLPLSGAGKILKNVLRSRNIKKCGDTI